MGSFLLNVGYALFVQIVIAIMLFGWLIVILDIIKGDLNFSILRKAKLGIFLTSVIIALPLIGIAFHRPVDVYDLAQTVLIITFSLLFDLRIHSFKRFKPSFPSFSSAHNLPTLKPQAPLRTDSELYRNLLIKARGDEGLVLRLIEYERKHMPYASQDELLSSAIDRWERDNR